MPDENEVGMAHACWGGSCANGGDWGHSVSGISGRGLSSSDGEGSQPLGGGGCGIENVRSCGTMDDELAEGIVAPRHNDSLNNRFRESAGWNCSPVEVSSDTGVER